MLVSHLGIKDRINWNIGSKCEIQMGIWTRCPLVWCSCYLRLQLTTIQ